MSIRVTYSTIDKYFFDEYNDIVILKQMTANEISTAFIKQFGEKANEYFINSRGFLDTSFKEEIILSLNKKSLNTDKVIVKCKFCGSYSLWGGMESKPTYWECEKCGDMFCGDCCHVDNENDDNILCCDCK